MYDNSNFDAIEGLDESTLHCLICEGRVYVTKCRMTGVEASIAMKMDVAEFDVGLRTYGGHIVADDIGEAEQLATLRNFGETVVGALHGMVSFNHNFINPYDTSEQSN